MIEVLVATYNGAEFLAAQLDSVLAQEIAEFRILIRDDGSTDGTQDIIKDYCTRYPERITDISDGLATGSAQGNFARLLQASTAEYVAFCDQDDLWHKRKLYNSLTLMEHCEYYLSKETGGVTPPILLHSDLIVMDDKMRKVDNSLMRYQGLNHKKRELRHLLVQNNITGNTVLLNRPMVDIAGEIPADVLMHDWWLGLVAAAFGHVVFLNQQTVLYRQHENNAVGAKDVYDPKYIKRKLETGQFTAALERTYEQAKLFLEVYGDRLPAEKRALVEAYAEMASLSKAARLGRVMKYGFWKQGLTRMLGQIAVM